MLFLSNSKKHGLSCANTLSIMCKSTVYHVQNAPEPLVGTGTFLLIYLYIYCYPP